MICSKSGPWIGSKNVVNSTWASLSEVSFMTRMCDFYSVKESLHKKILCFLFVLFTLESFVIWLLKVLEKEGPEFLNPREMKEWMASCVCLFDSLLS